VKKYFGFVLAAALAAFCVSAWAAAPDAGSGSGKVCVARLSGTVGVQMEEFVARVVARAGNEGAGLVVFELDTPGGLVEATRGITQSILESKVPVAMWVPPGGRAASAGAFMMQAAHVAAMASGTNIGAAHPVVAGGEDIQDSDMKKKIVNDLMAQMRTLVQLRGRNETAAERMVLDSISLTAREALDENVIDIVADDLASLLVSSSGRVVFADGRRTTVRANPPAERIEMSLQERLIQFLSSPDIAYMLLTGGLLALFYEVITPGGFILGTTGAVMLLLGGIGLKMLPFSWAGVALTGAGVIIMGMDLLLGGAGLLSLLGVACLAAGGLFLFQTPGNELLRVSTGLMMGMAAALGLCFTLFALLIARSLRKPVVTGESELIGLDAEVTEDVVPGTPGTVQCHGELWRARGEDFLQKGADATVVAVEGLTLVVKRRGQNLGALPQPPQGDGSP
jgi:membrane-bound serine protease (ClpP class)